MGLPNDQPLAPVKTMNMDDMDASHFRLIAFRMNRTAEESMEVLEVLKHKRCRIELAQESVDQIIIALGNLSTYGLPFEEVFDAVHEANMAKTPNPDPFGKPLKPEGWVSPKKKIAKIIEEYDNARPK